MRNKMKNWKKILGAIVTALVIFLIAYSGAGGEKREIITVNFPSVTVVPTENPAASDLFETYTEQLFLEEIKENTVNLHYTLAYPENFGITEYTPSLGTFSVEEMQQSYEKLKQVKEELTAFSYDELGKEQQFTYDIILDYINTELLAEDLLLYSEVLGPTTGYQVQLPVLLAEYTFRREQDVKDYLALVAQTDEVFGQIVEFEKQKSEAGLFMPDYVADAIITQCQAFIENPEENYLIEIFESKINAMDGLSEEKKQSYMEQNSNLVKTEVIWAYQALIEGLSALKGTGTNEKGLAGLEDGARYYEYLVRSFTGSSKPVEELMQETEECINSSLAKMLQIMTEDPNVINKWNTYRFCETEPEKILEDLKQKTAKDFPTFSGSINCEIKAVHSSLEEHMNPAFYLTPPIDDSENNVVYINYALADHNLYATMAHEGYPGHLLQTVYNNSKDYALIRNMFSFPGYTEGWATYAEYYAYGIGGIEEELAEVLVLNNLATLGIHAYVDMAVNYLGWGQEEIMQYLAGYGLEDADIQLLLETVVAEPANYLSYFIGYLEIRNLQDVAKETWGGNYSLKKFHEAVLKLGPAPFELLEKEIMVYE